jgi:transposase
VRNRSEHSANAFRRFVNRKRNVRVHAAILLQLLHHRLVPFYHCQAG